MKNFLNVNAFFKSENSLIPVFRFCVDEPLKLSFFCIFDFRTNFYVEYFEPYSYDCIKYTKDHSKILYFYSAEDAKEFIDKLQLGNRVGILEIFDPQSFIKHSAL